MCPAQDCPLAIQSRQFCRSPTCALINLVIGGRLYCPISVSCPVRLDVHPVILLRLAAILSQRWPARRGYVRELGVDTNVIDDLPDLCALDYKGNQMHLPTAHS